ncbi:unnamed protein product [Ceratitis capitata]|uniref:(Mediterranean fruit fly) hypothetical protein n=1 Tax=Ceratitis capitata TaxID=7213 RepID=A0A811URZ7_CERCA|nr:unnamed protein product [Ceratitis capitata]
MDLGQKLFALFFVNILFNLTSCAADTKGSIAKASLFTQVISKYYYVSAIAKMNWFQAVHFCRKLDSNLINIASKAEMDAITNFLIANGLVNKRFWTSANDLEEEGVYKSISNGQPIAYTKWGDNEPNNVNNEDCIEITAKNNIFYMNDNDCKPLLANMPYTICERENPEDFIPIKAEAREVVPPNCSVKKLLELCQSMGNIMNCRD